jgi:hypothetical protein
VLASLALTPFAGNKKTGPADRQPQYKQLTREMSMRRLLARAMAVIGLLLASSASTQVFATELWTPWVTITQLELTGDTEFLLVLSASPGSACTSGYGNSVYGAAGQHAVTAAGYNGLVALVMMLYTTQAQVRFLYDDATPYCFVRYVHTGQ